MRISDTSFASVIPRPLYNRGGFLQSTVANNVVRHYSRGNLTVGSSPFILRALVLTPFTPYHRRLTLQQLQASREEERKERRELLPCLIAMVTGIGLVESELRSHLTSIARAKPSDKMSLV